MVFGHTCGKICLLWVGFLNQIASNPGAGAAGISSEMLQMVVSLVIAGLHPAIVAQLIVEFVILGIFGSLQCYAGSQ